MIQKLSSGLYNTETNWCQLQPAKMSMLQNNYSLWINFFLSSGCHTTLWNYHFCGDCMEERSTISVASLHPCGVNAPLCLDTALQLWAAAWEGSWMNLQFFVLFANILEFLLINLFFLSAVLHGTSCSLIYGLTGLSMHASDNGLGSCYTFLNMLKQKNCSNVKRSISAAAVRVCKQYK